MQSLKLAQITRNLSQRLNNVIEFFVSNYQSGRSCCVPIGGHSTLNFPWVLNLLLKRVLFRAELHLLESEERERNFPLKNEQQLLPSGFTLAHTHSQAPLCFLLSPPHLWPPFHTNCTNLQTESLKTFSKVLNVLELKNEQRIWLKRQKREENW